MVKWVLMMVGDVFVMLVVDVDIVYVFDWVGYLYVVNCSNGNV